MEELFAKENIRLAVVGRNLDDLLPLLKLFPCTIVEDSPELVITHGGDGTLLGAELKYPGIPKCPVRDRKENPKCPKHSEISTLTKLFAGELKKTELDKLEVTAEDGRQLRGINDIILSQVNPSSAIRYRIWVDGELFRSQVVADSLVVSTPFGSTGYFRSITKGSFQTGIGLAFSNAMDLTSFAVVHPGAPLAVQLLRGPALMAADNNPDQIPLETGATIHIQTYPMRTALYGLDIFRCMDCYDLRKRGGFTI